MNLLSDPKSGKSTKTECLRFIDSYLRKLGDKSNCDTMEILKNVIKVFLDPKEPLRSLSIDIVCRHIGSELAVWDYATSIKYIIPIVVHSILSEEFAEKSEEIRLKLVTLLHRIIGLAKTEEQMTPICGDLVAILAKLLDDPHAEIGKKVCAVLIALSHKMRLHAVSKMLIERALPLLGHRQSKVRIAGIELVECLLLNGGHEAIQTLTGFREHNVVPLEWWFGGEVRANYFGALCRHNKRTVREAFFKMVFSVMTRMYERYDYKTLLLSYVLSGLQDECAEIQQMTFAAMEKIGEMHQRDDYNDLKRTMFFEKEAESIKRARDGDDEPFEFPFPFKHRPCLGSRTLIREHLGRIIHAVLSELSDWKDRCREMAVLLVRNMLIYAEEYCTHHTELLLSAMHRVISDKNTILAETAQQCCTVIGKHVFPAIWLDFLADTLCHEYDIRWVLVLERLVAGCTMKRLRGFVPRVVELMEFVLPCIDSVDEREYAAQIDSVLQRVNASLQRYEPDDTTEKVESQDTFQFSSEYCGFRLEIVDETTAEDESNEPLSTQQRIDRMLHREGALVEANVDVSFQI